ncbi:MAG: peptidoglycan-binding protein [Acidimicrobiia bacterium]
MSTRRRVALGIAALVVVGGVVVAVVVGSGDSASSASKPKLRTTLQPVTTRTLTTTQDVTGTVGFGTQTPVRIGATSAASTSAASTSSSASRSSAASTGSSTASSSSSSSGGIITGLPAVGTVVPLGGSLAEIDGAPSAFLMVGSRPMWRTLQAGVTDGPDVLQLEQSLAYLGYGNYFTMDSTFSSGTTSAIEAFQADRGVTRTGVLSSTDIVFLPGPSRVASQVATVGSTASGEILTVTGTTPLVHADLDSSLIADASVGAAVTLDLPDSTTVDGTILSIGAPTQSSSSAGSGSANGNGNGSSTTTTAPMDIATKADIGKFDGANVVVHLVTAEAKNALAVPVRSLLALAEGGYAVERVRAGTHQLVKVTPGTFAGGFVQVTGDVRAGDQVVSP